ncbi:uncharacterized protein [Macrobrachium rosenbergii]|uniref:uncharacterized protein n=1 Tax=Macrobrachium rosenbergii TaxID=79674 RepID=UPI0034D6E4ED
MWPACARTNALEDVFEPRGEARHSRAALKTPAQEGRTKPPSVFPLCGSGQAPATQFISQGAHATASDVACLHMNECTRRCFRTKRRGEKQQRRTQNPSTRGRTKPSPVFPLCGSGQAPVTQFVSQGAHATASGILLRASVNQVL